jgi:4-hydroxybutyryl-CoA dehydratase/vinylacetyl-CoA-Delta-isomerase
MRTEAAYLDSLRALDVELWADGVRIRDRVDHPAIRPSVNAVAMTFALAHEAEHRGLATADSELVGRPVNRFTHLFRSTEDLVRKVRLQRLLGRRTGTCFQRCVGMDALNALFLTTWEVGPAAHQRFVVWLRGVQERDEVICGAMTDAKGDRRKRPAEQPEQFGRGVGRRDGGVVIRGAKLHQTGAANSHQVLVMPGQALRAGEEAFAIACAVPVDAPGVVMVLGRQPSDDRKGGPDAGNATFGGQECVVFFEDVFVPGERVFLDGEVGATGTLVDAFAGYHRASYGGCKPGNLDVLLGAAAQVAEDNGVRTVPHVRDKLVEMSYLAETLHGLGLAASHAGTAHPAGVFQVDAMLANVCKQAVTRLPYEAVRLAEDLAGGLVSTLPHLAGMAHPRVGPILRNVAGSEARARVLRLVEYMTSGAGSVPLRIECMHGAGSPQAQRIVIERRTDWEGRMKQARRLAGVDRRET